MDTWCAVRTPICPFGFESTGPSNTSAWGLCIRTMVSLANILDATQTVGPESAPEILEGSAATAITEVRLIEHLGDVDDAGPGALIVLDRELSSHQLRCARSSADAHGVVRVALGPRIGRCAACAVGVEASRLCPRRACIPTGSIPPAWCDHGAAVVEFHSSARAESRSSSSANDGWTGVLSRSRVRVTAPNEEGCA